MSNIGSNSNSLLGRHRTLAPTASVRVSPLCLGAMTFGQKQKKAYGDVSKETAFEIMDHFYKEGGNFIDTANNYQAGESEEWVGDWMAARGNRDEIVLATKYTSGYMGGSPNVMKSNYIGNGTKSMKMSVEASLRKLKTEYIDLLYVHWWDYDTKIPEVMHSLNDLVVTGKVHYLGISDTPAWVVSKANEYARQKGLRTFSVYQGYWNAAARDFERDIIPMVRDEGMALCPWGALNQGRFQTEQGYKEREKNNPGRQSEPSDRDKAVAKVLETVAQRKGASLLNIALAYTLQKTPHVFPIVGLRTVDHLKGNIDALSVALSDEDIAEIETGYEFDHGFPHTFLSGTLKSIFAQSEGSKQVEGPKDVIWVKMQGDFDYVESQKAVRPAQK